MTKSPHPSSEDKGELLPVTEYLIRKGGAYYRPNAAGYTVNVNEAGRYSLEDAIRHSHPNGPDGPRDGTDYMPAPARQPHPLTGDVGMRGLLVEVQEDLINLIDPLPCASPVSRDARAILKKIDAALTPSPRPGDVGREAALVDAVRGALECLGTPDGYLADIGAPKTRALQRAFEVYEPHPTFKKAY